jgi:hypothetical protein
MKAKARLSIVARKIEHAFAVFVFAEIARVFASSVCCHYRTFISAAAV